MHNLMETGEDDAHTNIFEVQVNNFIDCEICSGFLMELSWELACPKERNAMKFCYTYFEKELSHVSSNAPFFSLVPMLANEFNVFSCFQYVQGF